MGRRGTGGAKNRQKVAEDKELAVDRKHRLSPGRSPKGKPGCWQVLESPGRNFGGGGGGGGGGLFCGGGGGWGGGGWWLGGGWGVVGVGGGGVERMGGVIWGVRGRGGGRRGDRKQ